jgi:hypothetical protein
LIVKVFCFSVLWEFAKLFDVDFVGLVRQDLVSLRYRPCRPFQVATFYFRPSFRSDYCYFVRQAKTSRKTSSYYEAHFETLDYHTLVVYCTNLGTHNASSYVASKALLVSIKFRELGTYYGGN